MAATKERFQNPAIGDTVNLRLFTFNGGNLSDLVEIEKVEIYFFDPSNKTDANPDGRRLVETIDGSGVIVDDVGTHRIQVVLDETQYNIGYYCDIWTVKVSADQPAQQMNAWFEVYPSLWYSTPVPVVYDFSFHFQPNKFRKGSKQYLIAEIIPNVPTASDLRKYYENLAIVSDLKISIEQRCGDCVPDEQDLRLIVDKEQVDFREKRHGFYQLDTTDMDCGIYDVWFQMDHGDNVYISDRMQLQIYD